jgi:ubiquinone/menaquinone biosynthesis C-methylase UbiE
MTNLDSRFAGSIPEIYDRYLGPVIFQPYADALAARVNNSRPSSVLETAAGTGILTRAMLQVLPETIGIIATDLNQPMLDYAAKNTPFSRATWRQADAMALPFEDESFDIVVCQFGVMFFPDKPAAYREARRVLRAGGRFLFDVWGSIENNDFADVITSAVAQLFQNNPPDFFPRVPHGYCDEGLIRRHLKTAEFSEVSMQIVQHTSRAASALQTAIGFCQGTPLRNEIEARDASRLTEATEAAAAALGHRFGNGPIAGKLQALVIEAVK